MPGIISTLPGASGRSEELEDASSGAGGLTAALAFQDRIARLIELYQRLGTVPMRLIAAADVASILCAMDDGRDQDALALLDIALEPPEADCDDEVLSPYEEFGSPIPDIARIWRHKTKPALAVVAGKESSGHERPKALTVQSYMAMDTHDEWVINTGDLDLFPRSRQAMIELIGKGEVIFVVRSGSLKIKTQDGSAIAEIDCGPDETRIARIVYCSGRARASTSPMMLHLEAYGAQAVNGIWCRSERKSSPTLRGAPDHDVVYSECFGSIGAATASAFYEGAEACSEGPEYQHRSAVARGDFSRFKLNAEPVSTNDELTLNIQSLSTRVSGIMAVPDDSPVLPKSPDAGGITRELIEHKGHIEVIVPLDGVVWVAVAPTKAGGPDDDPEQRMLTPSRDADGNHQAAFITPLVSTLDGGFDVMLLKPSYGHSVWTTPGSRARFVHLTFDDPAKIAAHRKPAGQAKPQARTSGHGARGR